ncbi:MAG: hypothetical protein CM1200mP27_13310 [Chloroflexota bacterium]|nr:MAG: hypothetical protein CM1200mP27_13310 [Chloroflexota bacterium]
MTVQEHKGCPLSKSYQGNNGHSRDLKVVIRFLTTASYLESGFEPGKVYQVIYTTSGAPVVGLGNLATRDITTFLRYSSLEEGNPLAGRIEKAYSFGVSQSGRF